MKIIQMYFLTAAVFFAVDIFWLGFAAKKIYSHYMAGLLRPQPNLPAAILFYLLFIAGMLYFAIYPSIVSGFSGTAWLKGALYGFFTYMTYELTCMAVLEGWRWPIVIIDIAWGTILSAVVSRIVYSIHSSFL